MRLLWTTTAAIVSFGVGVFALHRIELKWAATLPIAAILAIMSGALIWVLLSGQTGKAGKARSWLFAAGIANLAAGGFQFATNAAESMVIAISMILVGILLVGYSLLGAKDSRKSDSNEVTSGNT